ncbi:MAG TPA: ABC transporter permease [Trueperaceae bacterium]
MKRSVQEIVELLVFGLIALLIGTGLLWLAGWIFDLVGVLFKFFAALIWSLLRFIVPVAIGAAIIYALVRLIQQQREKSAANRSAAAAKTSTTQSSSSPAAPRPVPPVTEAPSEGEGRATASEIWAPPQPSPPASSTDTLSEPQPPEDPGPVGETSPDATPPEPAPEDDRARYGTTSTADASPFDDRQADASASLDPTPAEEGITGSVPAADDETEFGSPSEERPAEGAGDERDEDRHHH